jgi:hypothetical protein
MVQEVSIHEPAAASMPQVMTLHDKEEKRFIKAWQCGENFVDVPVDIVMRVQRIVVEAWCKRKIINPNHFLYQ